MARRYAKALYELAAEGSATQQVGRGLGELARGSEALGPKALAPGTLGPEARNALGLALARAVGEDTTLGRFVGLLASRDRLADLGAIAHWYARLEDEAAGRVRLSVVTAEKLSAGELAQVVAAFKGLTTKELVAEPRVDPDLIAGAVVELEGRVYDGSVRTYLARLGSRMAGTEG